MALDGEIENNLARLRQKRGLSAAHLAEMARVTRQTIYAMEASNYIPNTAVALRLARALNVQVEELFALAGVNPETESQPAEVTVLPGAESLHAGQPVQLCRVDKRLLAASPSTVQWCLPPSDAVLTGKAKVQIHRIGSAFQNRLLVAGCDPAISVLARHLQPAGPELVFVQSNSSQALSLLKQGSVHIAGTHLADEAGGESNLAEISRIFPRNSVAVMSFAFWEQGIVTARNNPKSIKGIEDLAREDVEIVNRDKGSGSRLLLDRYLKRFGIKPEDVRGYERVASGHLPAARQVQANEADCCIATKAAARLFGLGFIPLVSERYDFVLRRRHLDLLSVQALLDTLNRASFRRELESHGGYDTKSSGERIL